MGTIMGMSIDDPAPHPNPPPLGGGGSFEPSPAQRGRVAERSEGRVGGRGEGNLLRLLAWLSPSFPTGGYTYSHGIERAVEVGLVRDCATLTTWIAGILEHGAGRTDSVLFAATHRAVTAGDEAAFVRALERADVLRATSETALESSAQGTAFLTTVKAAWPLPELPRWTALIERERRSPAHAVSIALCAALAGIPLHAALAGFLHAVAANLVSAGVRLVPLGQTDGQRALAALEPVAARLAAWAEDASPDDLGSCAPMVDWTSMTHETQYTRLFRS